MSENSDQDRIHSEAPAEGGKASDPDEDIRMHAQAPAEGANPDEDDSED